MISSLFTQGNKCHVEWILTSMHDWFAPTHLITHILYEGCGDIKFKTPMHMDNYDLDNITLTKANSMCESSKCRIFKLLIS